MTPIYGRRNDTRLKRATRNAAAGGGRALGNVIGKFGG